MAVTEALNTDETTVVRAASPPTFKRRRVITMVVLFILTLGFYYPIWFLRRRAALNRLDSPRKLQLWPFALFLAWLVFQLILEFASAPATVEQTIGWEKMWILQLIQIALGILVLVQCFFIKDILEDHLAGPEDSVPTRFAADVVTLSVPMTFIFQIFYLQYAINKYIAGSKARTIS